MTNIDITGGGSGIGYAIAEGLKDTGNIKLIGGRREEILKEKAQKIGADAIAGDLLDSTSKAYNEIIKSNADIQIHAAAINIDSIKDSELQQTLAKQQNDFVQAKIENLKNNDINNPKLFIIVTSITALLAKHLGEKITKRMPYAQMKLDQTNIIDENRGELEKVGVQVSNIQPGAVNTEMISHLPGDTSTRMGNLFISRLPKELDIKKQETVIEPSKMADSVRVLVEYYLENNKVPDNKKTWSILNDEDLN